jgi:putative copper resistance protein D
MEGDLAPIMIACTALLNLALACAAGAPCAMLWLDDAGSGWAKLRMRLLRRALPCALLAAMLCHVTLLVLQSAVMADVPLLESREAVWSMLTTAHWGSAWMIGLVALATSMLVCSLRAGPRRHALVLAGLAVFFYSRSMVSHAASEGDVTLPMLADWLHLMSMAVWIGSVLAGATLMALPSAIEPGDGAQAARYVRCLSRYATVALAGIVLTGLVSGWHNLGSVSALRGNFYGDTLVCKLLLVAAAASLGAYNRFRVMPMLLVALDQATPAHAARRFTGVLRIEALLLTGVLAAAAVLSASSPPSLG